VIKGGSRSRLAHEALQSLTIAGQVLGKEFQSDQAAKLNIFGGKNLSHPALAEQTEDFESSSDKRPGWKSVGVLGSVVGFRRQDRRLAEKAACLIMILK